jgi:hypothetical protein
MDHKTLFPVLEMGFLFLKISGDQLHIEPISEFFSLELCG